MHTNHKCIVPLQGVHFKIPGSAFSLLVASKKDQSRLKVGIYIRNKVTMLERKWLNGFPNARINSNHPIAKFYWDETNPASPAFVLPPIQLEDKKGKTKPEELAETPKKKKDKKGRKLQKKRGMKKKQLLRSRRRTREHR